MSERTREALGDAANLVDAIAAEARSRAPGARGTGALCFLRVLEAGDRVWISIQPVRVDQPGSLEQVGGLLHLQGNLLRHYFRLQFAEQSLSTRARRRRPGGGRRAIRQIELERQRLGRELHTGVGQLLAAIRLQLEIIASHLAEPPAIVDDALNRIATLANDALEQVRSVSRKLHPPEWQRLTLEGALEQLWNISGVAQSFETELRIQPLAEQPALEIKTLLYRTAQEALSNVMRHSHAKRVDLALEVREGRVVLTIRDNGVGFNVAGVLAVPASLSAGIGLRFVREQAEALGATVQMESGPNGTTLEVSAPFAPAKE